MAERELITHIDREAVRERLDRMRESLPEEVEILVATKYVAPGAMAALADAGVTLVGENRLQDLIEKQDLVGERFTWDFIGRLQSRKAADVAARVRLIHSLASESARERLRRQAPDAAVLIQVNVSGEEAKAGVGPDELDAFIEACPGRVEGLMTMPPFATDPERSRPYFRRLAELAAKRDLGTLSMGTSQDWPVAVDEGATIVRVGAALLASP